MIFDCDKSSYITFQDDNRKIRAKCDWFYCSTAPTTFTGFRYPRNTPFRTQLAVVIRFGFRADTFIILPSLGRWAGWINGMVRVHLKKLMGLTDYWKRDKNMAPVGRDIFGDREWNKNRLVGFRADRTSMW